MPRPAMLTVVFTVLASLLVGPMAQVAFAPLTSPAQADDLESLKENAKKAKEELEEATADYKDQKKELEGAQDKLVDTLYELQQTELKLSEMREPLAEMAGQLYKQPALGAMGVMTSGSIDSDLQVEAHVVKIAEDRESLLDEASSLRDKQGELTSTAQELQSENQLKKVELEDDLDALRDKSEKSTKALSKELEDRGLSVESYMRGVECNPSKVDAAKDYPNGLLPKNALCEINEDGEYLRADAAIDFLKLNQEYAEHFGTGMCVTSSYRDLSNQQRLFGIKPPGMAAVPGTSNHGLGVAVDLCGGVQNQGSEQFNWLEANGAKYGWIHPQWAYSNPFEPWHWEYKP